MEERHLMKPKALNFDQLEILRKILQEQKDCLIFKARYSDEFNLQLEDRSDEVDQANADFSNSQRLRFRNRENFYEKKIDEALRRMEKKEYGFCRECEDPIRFSRLRARPTADLCIVCKEESERDESSNYLARQSKSRGRVLLPVGTEVRRLA
jgi:DnaK suppressor protein